MKKIKLFTLAGVIGALSLVSCNQDFERAPYDTSADTRYSFLQSNLALELSSSDDGQFPIVVTRSKAANAENIGLAITDANGIFTLASSTADFAAGEFQTNVIVNFDLSKLKLEASTCVVGFADADLPLSSSQSTTTVRATLRPTWEDMGTGTYVNEFFFDDPEERTIQKASEGEYYRILDAIVEGTHFMFFVDENDSISLSAQQTGFEHPIYGMISVRMHSLATSAENARVGNVFTFGLLYYVSAGTFNANAAEISTFTLN